MPGYRHRVAPRRPNANCPNRPSQTEYRKRVFKCGMCPSSLRYDAASCFDAARSAPQFDFRHRQASYASPCEIMPRAKASHCLRRISQGEPRDPLPLRNLECGIKFKRPSSPRPSPPGEGESFAAHLKICVAVFAGRSSAKSEACACYSFSRGSRSE